MTDLWQKLQSTKKPIILYGMGDGADKILGKLKGFGVEVSGVFCSDGFARNKTYQGFAVMRYEEIVEIFGNFVVLLCFGSSKGDVIENIMRISREQELYAPDVPVIGDGLFTAAYYKEHKRELDWVRENLADKWSVKVFDDIISYKLSGELSYLFQCETKMQEDQKELLQLGGEESFLDLGAYRGDTVEEFLALTGGKYRHITAVEPDRKNYGKLIRLEGENRRFLHAGIGEKSGEMEFAARGGRNSRKAEPGAGMRGQCSAAGGEKISMVCIDDLDEDFSYIKMDVEGQERAAILGGMETIRRYKPKLQVAAYHRNEDLFALPLLLKDAGYQVYLRHNRSVPAWDTNFFFC